MADLTLEAADLGVRVVHAGLDPVVQIGVAHVAELGLAVDLVLLSRADHVAGDHDADLANAGDVGVQQAALDLLGGQSLGEGLTRGIDHAVCHTDGLGQDAAQTDTGEDIHVVALARVVGAGLTRRVGEGLGGEGRARGEEAATVSVGDGALKVTLGLVGGVGEREDDGGGVPVGHLAEDLGGEDTTQGRQTHQDGGLDVVNDLLEGLVLLAVVVLAGKVDLVVGELVATVGSDQTLGVDEVEAATGLILGHALANEEVDNLLSDTDTGTAGTEEDSAVLLAGETGTLDGVDDTAENDSAGTLDVIVEAGVGIAVPLQCGEGVLEVLELDDNAKLPLVFTPHTCEGESPNSPGPTLSQSRHQLVHKLTLLLGADLVTAAAHVQRVFPEGLVASTQVQGERQSGLGTNTRTCGVQGELSNGDAHSVDAQIAQSEDTGAIGDTCDLHSRLGPIGDHGRQVSAIFPAQIHACTGDELAHPV